MADFTQFGSGVIETAKQVSGNCDSAGVADFLILQQAAVQEKRIEDRVSGASKQGGNGTGGSPQVSDPAVTGEASGARLRLQAMLEAQSRR